MSTATAPHRAQPRPSGRTERPPTAGDRRSHLRVVTPHPRWRAGRIVLLAGLVTLVALAGTAVLHTLLVSGQRDMDRLDAQITTTERENQALRLRVAELAAPERIVDAARRDGMVIPEEVTWVTPDPAGTSQVVPRANAPAPVEDSRAAGETDPDDGEATTR